MDTPKEPSLFENNTHVILQHETKVDAVLQSKAQSLWSVAGSLGLSGHEYEPEPLGSI